MTKSENPSKVENQAINQSTQKISGLVYHTPKDRLFPYEIEDFIEDRRIALIRAGLLSTSLDSETNASAPQIGTYKDIIDIPEEEIYKYFPYTFCSYLKAKNYPTYDVKVVADFSGMYIHNMDIVKVDFSGVIFSKCNFQLCNLESSIFRNADFSEAYFFDTNLRGVDLRGSNLDQSRFLGYEKNEISDNEISKNEISDNGDDTSQQASEYVPKLESIILSSSRNILMKSLQNNDQIKNNFCNIKENRLLSQIEDLDERINNRIREIDLNNKASPKGWFKQKDPTHNKDRKYNMLTKLRSGLERSKLEITRIRNARRAYNYFSEIIPYNTSPCMLDILNSNPVFDPSYLRKPRPHGNTKGNINKTSSGNESSRESIHENILALPELVKMDRSDMEKYLKLEDKISLNGYAKVLARLAKVAISDANEVIADFSSDDFDNKKDLSSMVFKDIDFSRTYFAGVNFSNSQFLNCNFEEAIFDGADFSNANFVNCRALYSSFFEADLTSAYIHTSDFSKAYMLGISANKISVDSSKFNFTDIRNSSWHESKIDNSQFNQADCRRAYFLKTRLHTVQMQYCIMENSFFNQCEIEKCDFQNSFAIGSEFMHSNISFSIFDNIKASKINMANSSLGAYVSFSNAVLKYGFLKKLRCTKVDFSNCNLEESNIVKSKLVKTKFENGNLKFALLDNIALDKCSMKNADISSAYLNSSESTNLNLHNLVAYDVSAKESKFISADFSKSDLRGANFTNSILTKSNFDSAYLENTIFRFANLQGASLNASSFNPATDFINANIGMSEGKLFKVTAQGNKEPVSIEVVSSDAKFLHKAENYNKVLRSVGNILSFGAKGCRGSDRFIQHPFKSYDKFMGLLGAIIFGIIAYKIAIIEMDLNRYSKAEELIPASISALISGVIGFALGRNITNILGITAIVATLIGALKASMTGAIVALLGACAAGYVLKAITHKSVDEYISYVIHKLGNNLQKLSEIIGLTKQQQNIIKERQDAISSHIPIRNNASLDSSRSYDREYDIVDIRKQNYYYEYSEGSIEKFTINDISEELNKLRPSHDNA